MEGGRLALQTPSPTAKLAKLTTAELTNDQVWKEKPGEGPRFLGIAAHAKKLSRSAAYTSRQALFVNIKYNLKKKEHAHTARGYSLSREVDRAQFSSQNAEANCAALLITTIFIFYFFQGRSRYLLLFVRALEISSVHYKRYTKARMTYPAL